MEKQKVCIIGGGLTGLITAASLSKLNIKVDLVTANIRQKIDTNRTTAISQENFNYLKKLNYFNLLEKDFWPSTRMKLYLKNEKFLFSEIFELRSKEKKKMLYMMNNAKITELLYRNLKKEKLVSFKFGKKVKKITSSGFHKSLYFGGKFNTKYNLIIFCTGSNSTLSKSFFKNEIFYNSYNELAISATLKHKPIENNIARQVFLDNEIFALLPISKSNTSIVWSIKKKLYSKFKDKKNFLLKKKIILYAKNFLEDPKLISDIELKELYLLMKKKYFIDRVLFFGDALHVVHPLAGQGFNMALRDLSCLERILKEKINLGFDIGSSDILAEFSNMAKPRNFAYSIGIDFLKNSFSINNSLLKNFRNKIISNLNNNDFAKSLISNLADKGFKF